MKKASKKVAPKKSTKTRRVPTVPVESSRSVRLTKAANGYTVSCWMRDKEITLIAKTKKEAMQQANKLFSKF